MNLNECCAFVVVVVHFGTFPWEEKLATWKKIYYYFARIDKTFAINE